MKEKNKYSINGILVVLVYFFLAVQPFSLLINEFLKLINIYYSIAIKILNNTIIFRYLFFLTIAILFYLISQKIIKLNIYIIFCLIYNFVILFESYDKFSIIFNLVILLFIIILIVMSYSSLGSITKVLTAFLLVLTIIFTPLVLIGMLIDEGFSTKTIKEYYSPDDKYILELVDHDEGALGGSNNIWLKKNITQKDYLIFEIKENEQDCLVYEGKWGEFDNIRVVWLSENQFQINANKYDVKEYIK